MPTHHDNVGASICAASAPCVKHFARCEENVASYASAPAATRGNSAAAVYGCRQRTAMSAICLSRRRDKASTWRYRAAARTHARHVPGRLLIFTRYADIYKVRELLLSVDAAAARRLRLPVAGLPPLPDVACLPRAQPARAITRHARQARRAARAHALTAPPR